MLAFSTGHTLLAADTILESDTTLTSEGYFVLSWVSSPETQGPIILSESTDPGFSPARDYEIPANGQKTITGLENGRYYFRAGTPDDWSEQVVIEVRHHSLARAAFFFFTGLALFLILVFTIVLGNRIQKGGSHAG